jgi:transcriptional regulator with XRE-family HTH domain
MSNVITLSEPSPLVRLVAENVRVECARADRTQADVARLLGTSRTAVSNRWRGRMQWQIEDLERLSVSLNVPVQRFFADGLPRLDSNQEPTDSPDAVVIDLFSGERVA